MTSRRSLIRGGMRLGAAAVLAGLARDHRREGEGPPFDRQAHALLLFVGTSLYATLAAWGGCR